MKPVEIVVLYVWLSAWFLARVFGWARRNVRRAVDQALDPDWPGPDLPPWQNDTARPARRQICRTSRHDYREECDA